LHRRSIGSAEPISPPRIDSLKVADFTAGVPTFEDTLLSGFIQILAYFSVLGFLYMCCSLWVQIWPEIETSDGITPEAKLFPLSGFREPRQPSQFVVSLLKLRRNPRSDFDLSTCLLARR
jgi:hypothetical protein